jgi:regulatory protein
MAAPANQTRQSFSSEPASSDPRRIDVENPSDTGTYRKALNSALRILGRRDHSVAELTQKLVHSGFDGGMIQRVVAECGRMGYLDDRRTARQLIDRMKRRGMGVRRIRHELQKRGLEGEQTEAQLRAGVTPSEERALARQVAEKKLKTLENETDFRNRSLRLQRFLRYRGFSDSLIVEMLKEMQS